MDGEGKAYYKNGKISGYYVYKNDNPVKKLEWYENGNRKSEKYYKEDKLIREVYYNENGELTKENSIYK